MSWKKQIEHAVSKASKCVFFILQLKRSGVDRNVLWCLYYALVRSILTYSFPAMCNMSQKLLSRFISVERRVTKIIGCAPPQDISAFCETLCVRLAGDVIAQAKHPLRELFSVRQPHSHSLRNHSTAPQPFVAKTSRQHESFIRFLR